MASSSAAPSARKPYGRMQARNRARCNPPSTAESDDGVGGGVSLLDVSSDDEAETSRAVPVRGSVPSTPQANSKAAGDGLQTVKKATQASQQNRGGAAYQGQSNTPSEPALPAHGPQTIHSLQTLTPAQQTPVPTNMNMSAPQGNHLMQGGQYGAIGAHIQAAQAQAGNGYAPHCSGYALNGPGVPAGPDVSNGAAPPNVPPAAQGVPMYPGGPYPYMMPAQYPQMTVNPYFNGYAPPAAAPPGPDANGIAPMQQPIPQSMQQSGFPYQQMPGMGYPMHPWAPMGYPGQFMPPVPQQQGNGNDVNGMVNAPGVNQVATGNQARPDVTPSQAGNNGMMPSVVSEQRGPYNLTEPRNYAPRPSTSAAVLPPPPAFDIGKGSARENGNGASSAAVEADPFASSPDKDCAVVVSSSTDKHRAVVVSSSRELVLVAPEEAEQSVAASLVSGPVPAEIRAMRSEQLNKLTDGPTGVPSADMALDPANFPFIESCSQASSAQNGVIKIKNIPFATKRAEIIAFLGRNSKILGDIQEPVHIIMERVTSKTQDAYVEFMTLHDAMRAVERHNQATNKGRLARLGDRPVDVELSSQTSLMKDLFPLAAGVFWDGSKPVIQKPIEGEPWHTFKGFVTEEEMTMLVKHVEIPQRSPFSRECPQRPFECMISTIKKMPWHVSSHITIRQRHAVYSATLRLMNLLISALGRPNRNNEATINERLLKRLVTAAMLCPGFSVVQKDNIAVTVGLSDSQQAEFNQPRFPDLWKYQQTLCPKPGVPHDVLEWYISVIREETTRFVNRKPISERSSIEAMNKTGANDYFGYLWYKIGFPSGKQFDDMSLQAACALELGAIERVLQRAFQ
ncbi:hypothetical protein B0T22DRAFT_438552 [Podospora appendiculata]|uniref:RRM domain-containing protein n=1 Tax=Podospora appendiculata TaxID=314037 RepID=A0AAE1CIS9_9PEZI|nr:hypothetical protein B0T22DRAFT_438552 [Podospora appendiculata]